MRANTNTSYRRKASKSYSPFSYGMRGQDFNSGASYQLNMYQSRGILEKTKQEELLGDTELESVEYIAGFITSTGEEQTLVFGLLGDEIKLRVVDVSGDILTPLEQTETAGVGTVSVTNGSNIVTGAGTAFNTFFEVGDYFGLGAADVDNYRIVAVGSDTTITLSQDYLGGTGSGQGYVKINNPGGLADPTFTGTVTGRQVKDHMIIGQDGSTMKWSGSAVSVLNVNDFGAANISMARDGSRLGYITTDGQAKFSDADPLGGFKNETGANAYGDYNCGLPISTAIIEGGTGVVIFGKHDAEAHWVQPNNASDEVSSSTKIESFSYRGRGVDSERFLTSTGRTIAFMNENGIFEMDSYSGKATNLIIGGKIERYWNEKIDPSNGFIAYDQENDRIVAQVALDSPQNNVFIAFDRREKDEPPFIVGGQYYNHAGLVNGKLVGGSNSDGKTYKLFEDYVVNGGTTQKTRYITEFDGLGALQSEKNLQSINVIVEAAPDAILKVRAYRDSNTESAFLEKTITVKDLTTPESGAVYGEYVLAVGAADLVKEKVTRGERQKAGTRFNTLAIEVLEESDQNFKIYDIVLEYKQGTRVGKSLSLKNNLF